MMASIPAEALACCDRLGDREAVVDGEERWTFAELGSRVRRAAAAMIAQGIEPGDRVAVWAPNSGLWVVAALGLQAAGATLVPINTRFKGPEAAPILARTHAKLLCTVTGFLDIDPIGMLAASDVELPDLVSVVILDGEVPDGTIGWNDFVFAGDDVVDAAVDARVAQITSDDLSDIMFTSGTTGTPKGVMMAHGQTLKLFDDWCDFADLREGDRYLIVNPFFHMFGYKAGWLACLLRGATILPVPLFDVEAVLERVQGERVTVFPGAPTIYQTILDHPGVDSFDLSSMRVAVTGAADIPVVLIERIRAELPFERVLTGYGLTEAGTCTGSGPDDDPVTIATTAGRAMVDVEVRIAASDGSEAPPGETGEIVVRGGNVMQGYLDDPDATAAAIDTDGWFHTGDLGTMDDRRYLRIVGRIKDMFIVGGFNAYPAEIENAVLQHDGVAQVAVIGIADERMGEVGCAFLVLTDESQIDAASFDAAEFIAWCRERMANYKVPREVHVVEEIPLNATGKVMKEDLRALRARE
ncbi:MAG: FadD3 family acyl-CoA ligase [Acidimicrobiales bacterium]|nr:FadD3 family acyl-CoA ligase [Acidimicrobiales bacterium]